MDTLIEEKRKTLEDKVAILEPYLIGCAAVMAAVTSLEGANWMAMGPDVMKKQEELINSRKQIA